MEISHKLYQLYFKILKINPDKILMMSPDDAILEFPMAPADGSEVVANGRPWRLSFVDGAYRVRNIQEGITWVFAVTDSEFGDRRPDAPVQDFIVTGDAPKNVVHQVEDTEVSNSFVNVLSPGSVAEYWLMLKRNAPYHHYKPMPRHKVVCECPLFGSNRSQYYCTRYW